MIGEKFPADLFPRQRKLITIVSNIVIVVLIVAIFCSIIIAIDFAFVLAATYIVEAVNTDIKICQLKKI